MPSKCWDLRHGHVKKMKMRNIELNDMARNRIDAVWGISCDISSFFFIDILFILGGQFAVEPQHTSR